MVHVCTLSVVLFHAVFFKLVIKLRSNSNSVPVDDADFL